MDDIRDCATLPTQVRICLMSLPMTKATYEENCGTMLNGLFGWLKR
ncbi:MAG: hypothetical protein M3430_22800 [Acidobacteriota bacterium]|nr:hypothetical protein [Acidobacteriota bacterium]